MPTLGISSMNEQSILLMSCVHYAMSLRNRLCLGVLLGSTGTILEQVPSSYPVKLFVEPGTQFHLHTSVGGKCI
ncbi:hypothetical protein SAMN05421766_103292 [Zobellia uliginosa]|uniref:Uncharacterized protein n=1 Tax=Zobellia uliginosa TaxID=143224 RepID=A0ABY1KR57_9FLAO|nr:hypothetical protein SAMN05421766_103292 [Zobellia uliginosa]